MDIIFQSGQFLSEDNSSFFPSLFGAIIGSGTTFLIFYLQGRRTRKFAQSSKKNELLDLYDYFNEIIKSIKTRIENQIPHLVHHSEKLKSNPFQFNQVILIENQDIDRISKKMDLERLFHSYLIKNENNSETKKEFKNLISRIDFIGSIIEQMYKTQETHLNRLENKLLKYKDLFEEQILSQAANILTKIKKNDEHYQSNLFWIEINSLIFGYNKNQPTPLTIEHVQDNLIKPMNRSMAISFKDLEDGAYLADRSRQATFLFNEIKTDAAITSREFDDYKTAFQDTLDFLYTIDGCG